MHKLRRSWIGLRSSLWFVPALIVAGAVALALGLIQLDTRVGQQWMLDWPRLFGVGAEGTRGMLAAIASSMITVAGVTFSITIAALAQASSQYTPRILRNFMRDRANQTVLGVFSGIFAYCLVVLRTIRSGDEVRFVPHLASATGFLLALLGIGVLIFFIHHIAASLQASSIIAAVTAETLAAVDALFPQEIGAEADAEQEAGEAKLLAGRDWQTVVARQTGYIQSIDSTALLRFANEHDTVLRMERGIGEYIVAGTPLASLALAAELNGKPNEKLVAQVNDLYVIEHYRTVEQDAAFGVRQIVDIALKALSPGVNDTTTAVTCIDYLSAILARLAARRVAAPYRYEQGKLRVIAASVSFEQLLALAFHQIRQNAAGNVAVMMRLLDAIETIAAGTPSARRRGALLIEVELIEELADTISSAADRREVDARLASVTRLLTTPGERALYLAEEQR